jgi:peptidoglycan/LPS O-acetylase OafA/YrhL
MTENPVAQSQIPADLKPLTSMRFVAAMWVVMFHYWPKLDIGWTSGLVTKGYLGVELFFVLSGFILCHVYLAAAGEGRFRYGSFLWARLARVYPLHLATLIGVGLLAGAATVAGMAVDGNILSWRSLPANLLMVHAWGFAPDAGWNHPSWSISAEWFAYLCFPLFAWAAWRMRARPMMALGLTTVGLMGSYLIFQQLAGFPLTQATIDWGMLRIVPCFAFGCAAYLAYRAGGVSRGGLIAGVSAILIVAAALAQMWDGVIVALFGPLILGLGSMKNEQAGWLSSRAGVYLGEISYSVYMICIPWQLLAVNAAAKLTGAADDRLNIVVWLSVVAAIPVIAAISHHLIERPARKAMRDWADRRDTQLALRNKTQHAV